MSDREVREQIAQQVQEFANSFCVYVGDEESEWWRGYRQAQREALMKADRFAERTKDLIENADADIERVRQIHTPIDALNVAIGKVQQVCTGCGKDDGNWEIWPCPTIRALEEGGRR